MKAIETTSELQRLECRKNGELVNLATGETVGTWTTDEDGFVAQIAEGYNYHYIIIINDPTEDPHTAGTLHDCTEEYAGEYFAELGIYFADGLYTDLEGVWHYTVGKEETTADMNVPLTNGEWINLNKIA